MSPIPFSIHVAMLLFFKVVEKIIEKAGMAEHNGRGCKNDRGGGKCFRSRNT